MRISELGGSFLESSNDFKITKPSGESKIEFNIKTIDDAITEANGLITVSIKPNGGLTNSEYKIGYLSPLGGPFATVEVYDNDSEDFSEKPTISISTEFVSAPEGHPITFKLNAFPVPSEPIRVILDTEQEGELFLWRTLKYVEINSAETKFKMTVELIGEDDSQGRLIVSISDESDQYLVESDASVASIDIISQTDSDTQNPSISIAGVVTNSIMNMENIGLRSDRNSNSTIPEISVFAKATTIDEGASAEFIIRSQSLNFQDFLVTFEISEQGQFIGREPVSQVKLTNSIPVTWVVVETENDEIAEEDGKVTLRLNK